MGLADVVNIFDNKVYNEIEKFLDKKYLISESDGTRSEYKRDIVQFFNYLTNDEKSIEHLSIEDIQLDQNTIEDYQMDLFKSNKYANSTINRKLAPVRELYKRFHRLGFVDNISMFSDIKSLKENDNSYGIFSVDEVYEILEFVKNRPRSRKRMIKYHLIRFSIETRARLEECLSLKWSNFEVQGENVVIHIIGKGNKDFKPNVARWFYDELLELKNENSDEVFDISKTAIQDMMNDIISSLNFPEERHLAFHSWRKTGASFLFKFTKDLEYTRKSLNHSSITTTQRYIQGVDYGIQGMFSIQKEYDENAYKNASREDLIKAIEKLDKAEIMRINMNLNNI